MSTLVHEWLCGNGHRFTFGDEVWHHEVKQYDLEDGAPVPMYCTEDFDDEEEDESMGRYAGEPCLDSTSLIDEGVKR